MKEPRYRSDPGTEEAFYAGREDVESGRSRQPDTLATFAAAVHAVKQEAGR